MKSVAKGTRVVHPRHGKGVVVEQGVILGTVLVHYDWQEPGLAKVTRISELKRR